MSDEATFRLWRAPTSIWVYGLLRAAAFAMPFVAGSGGVGIGLFIVLPLFVFLLRGSVRAWGALLVFDSLSFAILLSVPDVAAVPLLLPMLMGGALIALLVPSTRRYVTQPRTEVADGEK